MPDKYDTLRQIDEAIKRDRCLPAVTSNVGQNPPSAEVMNYYRANGWKADYFYHRVGPDEDGNSGYIIELTRVE